MGPKLRFARGDPAPIGHPQRVGAHRLILPIEWVIVGDNQLTLVPETTVTAGSAGPRFAWLDPADTVGVRLWYVRVLE